MAIRKEQVLALLALGTLAMCGRDYLEEPTFGSRFAPNKAKYEPGAIAPAPLVTTGGAPFARADFFTEPSETQPLPPRRLDFPPRAPLSVSAVPLEIGPDFGHMWMLRLDGTPLEGVAITQGGDTGASAPAAAPTPEAVPSTDRKVLEEQAARTYDRIYIAGLSAPFLGTIEPDNHPDLFAFEDATADFTGVKLRMRRYDVQKQKVGEIITLGNDPQKIEKVVLAGTVRNEIRRRVRKAQGYDLDKRRQLIDWLLDKAREDTAVYDEAMKQAEAFRKEMPASEGEGVRLVRRVLRARGDLAGELALLESLPTTGFDASFRFEGLGITKARLCLWAEAEADLRQAVALKATDARPHAALAEFLRLRGRSGEAVLSARRAEQTMGSVPDAADRARVSRVIVACHLAVGDVDAARAMLQQAVKGEDHAYLTGCVEYAAGQTGPALAAFRQAAGSADGGAATLGQAACLLREGKCQEAYDLFVRVHEQEPMLRHRAATGLALLFVRIAQYESANQWLDRALEADPQDPYAHYLRGRTLRLSGQVSAAAEALTVALQKSDDFVHALAEMAAVKAQSAVEGYGAEADAAVLAARRYVDRAVALVKKPAVELFELQGLAAYVTAEPKAAEASFTKARDLATDVHAKWYGMGALAVVAYSRGLVEDALGSLDRMIDDLGKDEPLAKWAAATRTAIEDHSQKETLTDGFERDIPGTIWTGDADGTLVETIRDGRLVFAGTFTRGDVAVQRDNAAKPGKKFLAVSTTMQLGPKHSRTDVFAGLGIELQSGRSGAVDFVVRVGVFEGKPVLRIEDGRAENGSGNPQAQLAIDGFDDTARQSLELRVVPLDEQSKMLTLLVSWNGVVVHRRDLKGLTANTTTELKTILFVTGKKGREVNVAFDDYRLERRKER